MRVVLLAVSLVLACASSRPSGPSAPPPLQAFECAGRVEGKRTTGTMKIRFEPGERSAQMTMAFTGDEPGCDFAARWSFPQNPRPVQDLAREFPKPWCQTSALSPFAVACDLVERPDLVTVSEMSSELRVVASGALLRRQIAFRQIYPASSVQPLPSSKCQGLPVRLPEREGEVARISITEPGYELFTFEESHCALVR